MVLEILIAICGRITTFFHPLTGQVTVTQRSRWLPLLFFIGLIALAVISIIMATSSSAAITIKWSTATELDTAGFNLYRAESNQGPYTRLNTDLIPASPDPFVGGSYVFTDTSVVAGQTYFYQLEDIDLSGAATRHDANQVTAESNLTLYVALLVAALIIVGGAVAWIGRKN